MPRSNYKLFQSSEMEEDVLNVENSDHMEENSLNSENSSDIFEEESVEIDRDSDMDYGEEISDYNGNEALEGTETVSEFERLLVSQEDEMADEARKLWNYNRNNFSTHDLCNKCGTFLNRNENCSRCEGSTIATFVRIGGFFQILDLVETFLADIVSIRRELKNGKDIPHSLNSHFFSEYWKKEADDHLNLSTVLSIDGVHISGTTKKLWPVSLILVDLPTGLMQRSTSVVLEGLVECPETPSTAVWNSIIPFIVSDIERSSGKIGGFTIKCYIATVTADQPAKRAFFGMKSHQSSGSCFYCLSENTFYKLRGDSRRGTRFGELTAFDSRHGQNGFGSIPSKIINIIHPYDTPIDLLHALGEGIFERIRKELMPKDIKLERKSEIFVIDEKLFNSYMKKVNIHSYYKNLEACRNGTDKTNFFRLVICLIALECPDMTPEARTVLVALSMLANKMYSDSSVSELFDVQLCAAAAYFLIEANEKYITIKAHEILFHLPEVNQIFRNTGPLSTNSFESYYQFALSGYSTSTTRFFVQNACTKVLLHSSIRREIAHRSTGHKSSKIQKFLSLTSDIIPTKIHWMSPIIEITAEELASVSDREATLFGRLSLGIGTLTSNYSDRKTKDDMFFAETIEGKKCFRFVAAIVKNFVTGVLAEPINSVTESERFARFGKVYDNMDSNNLYYASEVHRIIKEYDGIQCGILSGRRTVISVEAIKGISCYIESDTYTIFIQANGALLHN